MTTKTLGNERYNIPTVKDFGNSATEVTTKKRTNQYGRVLFGKTSVPPNVVREEIRYLNRSYNKKRTNRYGRVLFGKTSVSPNVVREEIRYLNRSFNEENEVPRHWTTSDITSQMSKTLGLQHKNNEERTRCLINTKAEPSRCKKQTTRQRAMRRLRHLMHDKH